MRRSQQVEEDEALARRLQLEADSEFAVVEQISITEEQQAAVCLQQMEEDKLLARRLQVEDDSDIAAVEQLAISKEDAICFQQAEDDEELQVESGSYIAVEEQISSFEEAEEVEIEVPSLEAEEYEDLQAESGSDIAVEEQIFIREEEEISSSEEEQSFISEEEQISSSEEEEEEDAEGNDYELEERQGAVRTNQLSATDIQRFPTKVFQRCGGGNMHCQICLCDYSDGDELRILSCFHDYHVHCIDQWLKDNSTCPFCRVNLADPDL